jgi:hypothetical protein
MIKNPYYDIPFASDIDVRFFSKTKILSALSNKKRIPSFFRKSILDDSVAEEIINGKRYLAIKILQSLIEYNCLEKSILEGIIKMQIPKNLLSALFSLSLIDFGFTFDDLFGEINFQTIFFKRNSSPKAFKKFIKDLTVNERLVLSHHKEIRFRHANARHDCIAGFLSVSAQKLSPAKCVIGELSSKVTYLTKDHKSTAQNLCDLTLIRKDGLRICVEVSNYFNATSRKKITFWIKQLDKARLEDTGVVLLFLISTNRDKNMLDRVLLSYRSAIYNACQKYPGRDYDKTIDKVFVVDFTRWFTQFGKTGEFDSLVVNRVDDSSEVALGGKHLLQSNANIRRVFEKVNIIKQAEKIERIKNGAREKR